MDADELRNLADALEPMAPAPRFSGIDAPAACAYLRACADALDAGPVAWVRRHPDGTLTQDILLDGHIEQVRRDSGAWSALYPLAMPAVPDDALRAENERLIEAIKSLAMSAQAQALRLPEPLTDAEVHSLLDDISHLPSDFVVREIEATVIKRVKEANE